MFLWALFSWKSPALQVSVSGPIPNTRKAVIPFKLNRAWKSDCWLCSCCSCLTILSLVPKLISVIDQELQNFFEWSYHRKKKTFEKASLTTCAFICSEHAQVQEEMFRLYSFSGGKAADQIFAGLNHWESSSELYSCKQIGAKYFHLWGGEGAGVVSV